MTNRPDAVEVLRELAKRYRARVSALNLHDPTVATSKSDWRDVFEHKPPPPDRFRHQVKLKMGPLIEELQQPGDEPVDFSDLPLEFEHLVPLMKSWAIGDDEERNNILSRASNARLQRLVNKVVPHLDAIDKYLDGFRDRTLPESATVLGCLAECTCEAQLLLTKRQANAPRNA